MKHHRLLLAAAFLGLAGLGANAQIGIQALPQNQVPQTLEQLMEFNNSRSDMEMGLLNKTGQIRVFLQEFNPNEAIDLGNFDGMFDGLKNIRVEQMPWSYPLPNGGAPAPVIKFTFDGGVRYGVQGYDGNFVLIQPEPIAMNAGTNCFVKAWRNRPIPCFSQTVYLKAGEHRGSGVLIHPQYVLTALHVVLSSSRPYDMQNPTLAYARDIFINNGSTVVDVAKIELVGNTGEYIDLAILRLDEPVLGGWLATSSILDARQSIAMQTRNLIGIGFGITPADKDEGARRIGMLQYETCDNACSPFEMSLQAVPFTGTKVVSNPCAADSGSPVYVESKDADGRTNMAVVGILSGIRTALVTSAPCASQAIYVDLTNTEVQQAVVHAIEAMQEQAGLASILLSQLDFQ